MTRGTLFGLVLASLCLLALVGTPAVAADAAAPTTGGGSAASAVVDDPGGGGDGVAEHCVFENGEVRHCKALQSVVDWVLSLVF